MTDIFFEETAVPSRMVVDVGVQAGDPVCIKSGAYKGLRGKVLRELPFDMARIDVLGHATVDVLLVDLEPMDPFAASLEWR